MSKISKKYIGADQVGSVQIELENGDALRSKNSGGVSVDLMELDPSNLLQILQQPFLPGNASSALQAIPKQQLDSAVSSIGSDISALQLEDLTFVKLDGSRSMTGDLSMMPVLGTHYKITGLNDPSDPRDAANKQYVDAVAEGLHIHAPVTVIINQTLEAASGGSVVYDNGVSGVGATLVLSVPLTAYDTYTFQNSDRVIVNGQANSAYNGIYTVGTNGTLGSVFTRALDFNTPAEIAGGDFVFVQYGTLGANTGWVEPLPVTSVGADPITFIQFSGAGTYVAGDGLVLLGNEFNVKADLTNFTTEINASNQVAVKLDPAGQLSTSASGVAISSAFQGRMSTAESNITALQTGKANTNLDNLAAGDTSIPAGVDLRSLETDQSLGFRLFTANQASSVSGAVQIRSGTTAGFLSGGTFILPGLNSAAAASTYNTAATGSGLLRSGTITGGTKGATGYIAIQGGDILGTGVTGITGPIYIESGENNGLGGSGFIRAVTGFSKNASSPAPGEGSSNTGQFIAGSGKSLAGRSGSVFLSSGEIANTSGFDNSASTQATGSINVYSGEIANASSSAATGNAYFETGTHTGSGTSGRVSVTSGENYGTGASGISEFASGNISNVASAAASGAVYVNSGSNAGSGITGAVNVGSGGSSGTGTTGTAQIQSGIINNAASSADSGFSQIRSGDNAGAGKSGDVYVASGNNLGTGNSGNIQLYAGTVVSGTRGYIQLVSRIVEVSSEIDMTSHKIINLTDPSANQDAATKAYVDSKIASGTNFLKQIVTLSATNISNGYVDLASEHIPESTVIGVGQRVNLYETLDYTVSVVSSVTRVTFAGPSAVGGAEELEDGDILYIQGVQA